MGKKVKIGKQRRDKYYFLSKEAGYRSRAAFKLIQLNKRFEFLQNSRVLVDLCAAPGGWLQVAVQNMPVSSIRIGVDLVPIRAIKDCITLQGDITEEKTRHAIKKELKDWDADCVLHDGAPNIGTNWTYDAFSQNCLTLQALRLATQILKRGGYFVTKIFRSADYLALVEVFKKLFKRVNVWKPAASRLESAEIFVYCEGYQKPDRVDPELLDAKKVFAQQTLDGEGAPNPHRLLMPAKKKEKRPKALGYADGELLQHHELKASEFVSSPNPLLLLSQASSLVFDTEELAQSAHTTGEVRECASDVKVCGPGEVKQLLGWRKKVIAERVKAKREREREEREAAKKSEGKDKAPDGEEEEMEEDAEEAAQVRQLEEIDEAIRNAAAAEKAQLKRKKRQLLKQLTKQREREKYEMTAADQEPLIAEDLEVFSLKRTRRLAAKLGAFAPHKILQQQQTINGEENGGKNAEKMDFEFEFDGEKDDKFASSSSDEEEEEVYGEDEPAKKKKKAEAAVKLTPEELALGELMIYSKKSAQDLEDWGWNRYASNDDALPSWFVDDEKKHWRKELPVEKSRVDFYKDRERSLNTRSIKKVVEAKMRKKKRTLRRMERARKQAEGIVENENLEQGEKMRELKRIYKKAEPARKRRQLQVVTRGKSGTIARPKGPFKLVDRRMKKDMRSQRAKTASGGGTGGGASSKRSGKGRKGGNGKGGKMNRSGGRGKQKKGGRAL